MRVLFVIAIAACVIAVVAAWVIAIAACVVAVVAACVIAVAACVIAVVAACVIAVAVKLKASLQLNASLHIHPFTIITEEPIHFIKMPYKAMEIEKLLHSHRQRNATSSYLPTRATSFVMYQCIITSARIQYPTAACLSYDV